MMDEKRESGAVAARRSGGEIGSIAGEKVLSIDDRFAKVKEARDRAKLATKIQINTSRAGIQKAMETIAGWVTACTGYKMKWNIPAESIELPMISLSEVVHSLQWIDDESEAHYDADTSTILPLILPSFRIRFYHLSLPEGARAC